MRVSIEVRGVEAWELPSWGADLGYEFESVNDAEAWLGANWDHLKFAYAQWPGIQFVVVTTE